MVPGRTSRRPPDLFAGGDGQQLPAPPLQRRLGTMREPVHECRKQVVRRLCGKVLSEPVDRAPLAEAVRRGLLGQVQELSGVDGSESAGKNPSMPRLSQEALGTPRGRRAWHRSPSAAAPTGTCTEPAPPMSPRPSGGATSARPDMSLRACAHGVPDQVAQQGSQDRAAGASLSWTGPCWRSPLSCRDTSDVT